MMTCKLGRVAILGSSGMVGSSIVRRLSQGTDVDQIIPISRAEVNLADGKKTADYIAKINPDWIVFAAAKVGGIHANNTYPKDFIYDNLALALSVIDAAYSSGVEKLIMLGSSCIYPKLSDQPMKEESLMTGLLEPTNEPYAIAKIASIKLCESYNRQYRTDYRTIMPTNLYGPGDNYHPENSHVIPGLIRRFHKAKVHNEKTIVVWGSGNQKREFLHVDDLADAVIHMMQLSRRDIESVTEPTCSHINVGTGIDLSIAELARKLASIVGYEGTIEFDTSKADGAPKKLLDVEKIQSLGWLPKINLDEGLRLAYEDFVQSELKDLK